jgi:hypothetical protein
MPYERGIPQEELCFWRVNISTGPVLFLWNRNLIHDAV